MDVILGELIQMVQATAPVLWAIAQRQVFANTVGSAMWGLLCIVATIALAWGARYCMRRAQKERGEDGDLWAVGGTLVALFAIGTLVAALCCLNNVVVYSINPDYYAIKVLLQLVR